MHYEAPQPTVVVQTVQDKRQSKKILDWRFFVGQSPLPGEGRRDDDKR